MRHRKRFIPAVVTTVLTSALACLAEGQGPSIGHPAPPFTLGKVIRAPAGTPVDWEALHGKVVVLEFWATWCGPCRAAIPHWNRLVDAFRGKPVKFIAITDEPEQVVTAFLKWNPIHSWVGLDGPGVAMREAYGIKGVPSTVVVNQKGVVVAVSHPMLIQPENIQEVINTGRSSLQGSVVGSRMGSEPPTEALGPAPPLFEVSVRRSGPLPAGHGFDCWSAPTTNGDLTGQYATVKSALLALFSTREIYLDCHTPLPSNLYDFTVRLPTSSPAERQQAVGLMLHQAFGLKVMRRKADRQVYALKLISTNAPGLRLSTPESSGGGGPRYGELRLGKARVDWLLGYLEGWLHKPVINESGLTNRYDIRLSWKLSPSELLSRTFDPQVLNTAEHPDNQNAAKLSAYQQRELAAIRGQIAGAELEKISPEDRENIRLLRRELAKPEPERFLPQPQSIITAVREELGLALVLEQRPVSTLVVGRAQDNTAGVFVP